MVALASADKSVPLFHCILMADRRQRKTNLDLHLSNKYELVNDSQVLRTGSSESEWRPEIETTIAHEPASTRNKVLHANLGSFDANKSAIYS
jgi:hypothetical protein